MIWGALCVNQIHAGSCHWKCFAGLLAAEGEGAESRRGSWQMPPPRPPQTTMEVGIVSCCPLGCAVALPHWVLLVGTERAVWKGHGCS